MAITKVVCGLALKGENILICRRQSGKSLKGYWEFPGGKVEALESYEESLCRELMEELNLTIEIKQHFKSTIHHYDNNSIELISFICSTEDTVTTSTDHDRLEWVKVQNLLSWKLAPADIHIAKS